MSENELMEAFPPVPANSVKRTDYSPLTTKADTTMLFVVTSLVIVAVCFIAVAVLTVVTN